MLLMGSMPVNWCQIDRSLWYSIPHTLKLWVWPLGATPVYWYVHKGPQRKWKVLSLWCETLGINLCLCFGLLGLHEKCATETDQWVFTGSAKLVQTFLKVVEHPQP